MDDHPLFGACTEAVRRVSRDYGIEPTASAVDLVSKKIVVQLDSAAVGRANDPAGVLIHLARREVENMDWELLRGMGLTLSINSALSGASQMTVFARGILDRTFLQAKYVAGLFALLLLPMIGWRLPDTVAALIAVGSLAGLGAVFGVITARAWRASSFLLMMRRKPSLRHQVRDAA